MTLSKSGPPIACVGDIMLELITHDDAPLSYQQTLKIDFDSATVGGPVCNLAWYFSQLMRPTTIIAHYGRNDRDRLRALLEDVKASGSSLLERQHMTDLLVVAARVAMPALYLTAPLPRGDATAMTRRLDDVGTIVFGGSRHPELRRAILERVSSFSRAKLVFSPSYSLYDFGDNEIRDFVSVSHIVVVNEHEADYLMHKFAAKDVQKVMAASKEGGIVTRGSQGATLYQKALPSLHIPSVSGRVEDVIGAGEAFVCGFLHAYLAGCDWAEAGRMGAAVAAQVVQGGQLRVALDRHLLPAL